MIEVIGLTKRYGPNTAVDNITFTVPKGKVYGFLGPNGAGKSTTMNMITGYLSASDGTAKIDGVDIFDEPVKAKRKMGYLPEQPPVYPDMTPLEYLTFAAELKGIAKKERMHEIESAMSKTEITDMRHRLIRNLSKGYCQRVGLAAALLGEPEVLILDEPTVGLDPKQIAEMRVLIANLREKHTILLSSHILSEVSAICDCVIIISKGKIAALDTPDNLALLMQGKTAVTVTAEGTAEQVIGAIKAVLPECTIQELEPDDAQNAKLLISDTGNNARAQIGRALMDAGLVCLELSESRISLEDVFLELTGQEESEAEHGDFDFDTDIEDDGSDNFESADADEQSENEEEQER